MKNILILSAGRRVELVQHFRRAAGAYNPGVKIVAADAKTLAPALYVADIWVQIERVDSPLYISRLCEVIIEHDVALIIPTIDPELAVLARNRAEIESRTGARVLVADETTINTCNDKVLTAGYLESCGFNVPALIADPLSLPGSSFPVFLKPRSGSSGIGATVVTSREELEPLLRTTVNPMVQQLATGVEYTVDCFSDLEGRPLSAVPRLRIAVRGGEILQGKVERNDVITTEVVRILASLEIPGPSSVQCFFDGSKVQFIEINPRFGGGAPMSISAGADSCMKLLKLLDGERLEYDDDYVDGLTFLRFDQALCLGPDGEVIGL